jgi:NAD(P)-dependent dehydrogenase (short-subunit alcohol dehydrogenase family)
MTDLTGKRALVTGASAGLGAHFARTLARAGAEVLLAARRKEALAAVADRIMGEGGRCRTIRLDVADPASIAGAEEQLAGIDILVNNAGVVREGAALDQSEDDWDQVIDTNLKGSFLLARSAARVMRAHGRGGAIVNIASILGLRQGGGVLSYAVSKAAVIQLTKTLALELARYKIRVNALAPGYIATDLNGGFWESEPGKAMIRRIPQRRLGRPEDLDGPLLLLASDAAAYMTGSVLIVDGGHLVSPL